MTKKLKKVMTKEAVCSELLRLQSEGHSMKITDFDSNLLYSMRLVFGGYTNAKKELGITTKMTMTDKRKERDVNFRKYSEEDLANELRQQSRKCEYLGDVYETLNGGVKSAIVKRHGGFSKFAAKHGITLPPKKDTTVWTEERIAVELRKVSVDGNLPSSKELVRNGHRSLVGAVRRNYGSWNKGIDRFGYRPFYAAGKTDWTKDEVVSEALSEIIKGCLPYREHLAKRIRGFDNSVEKFFGTYDDFKEYAGYCVIATDKPAKTIRVSDPNAYQVNLRTKDGLKREILRLYYIGCPLNYNFVTKTRRHLNSAAQRHFGSWRQAVEYAGFNYDEISVSDNSLSEAGYKFESVLADILSETNPGYKRFAHETLNPDFVLPDGHWIDAKLSEWTDCLDMLKRYLPECSELTVIYLRGSKRTRFAGTTYRHRKMSVYELTKQLPEDRRKHYEERFAEIETAVQAA